MSSFILGISFTENPHTIFVTPNGMVNLQCKINCSGIDWTNTSCGIQQNVIVIVPSDNYAAYEVCFQGHTFRMENYNISAVCDRGDIDSKTLCNNMEIITYNVTLWNFNESSLQELVILCGMTPTSGLQPLPSLMVNGLLHRKYIIKVQGIK